MNDKLEALARLIYEHQRLRYAREYGKLEPPKVRVRPGKRWTKIDVGDSGKYMVDTDGAIYGIKAYGAPHYGHRYGTLDTINEWDWSGYVAVPVSVPA